MFNRRAFLTASGATIGGLALAGCGESTATSGGAPSELKFWDMPWGLPGYPEAATALCNGYSGEAASTTVEYQSVQWNNFNQTFASAIASGTGPAVSSGGAFQAFQYAEQGSIIYADNVIDALKKSGDYDDFIPGVIDEMKTDAGYVAVPWLVDIRAMWYRKSLLEQAGAEVPTDWDSLKEAGKALKEIGVYGFGVGAGPGHNLGQHVMISFMINNGGGWFNEAGELDCVTDRNIEAMEFIRELVSLGIIDPGSVAYTSDNLLTQWEQKRVGMGMYGPSLHLQLGDGGDDILVTSPLTGPHGDKGTMRSVNNLMMYTDTPSQEESEAFLLWYLDAMGEYWEQGLLQTMPARKSIAQLPAVANDAQLTKVFEEWSPIGRSQASRSSTLSADLAALDGNQQLQQFAQTILEGSTPAETALTTLHNQLSSVV